MEGGSRSHRDQNDGSGSSQSQSGTRRGFRGTAENAKTKLCLRWQSPEGCRFGDRCNFAHGESELRKLPSRKQAQLAQQTASVNQQGGGAARQQQQQQQVFLPSPPQGAAYRWRGTPFAATATVVGIALLPLLVLVAWCHSHRWWWSWCPPSSSCCCLGWSRRTPGSSSAPPSSQRRPPSRRTHRTPRSNQLTTTT
mmetsp:Transcript_3680/g.10481  ORF Transcript_3680/g.10481 Transcript_3680/m.10481 type:complete len:196 (+) Transcript_3680:373-960(+)